MAKPTAAAPLRAIQAFAAVVRAGSVVGASDALTVTASAVSHLLRQLETRLGVQLFTRHGRRLVLTADGERLAAAVVPALAAIDDAVGGFIRRGIELRISLLSSFAVHWLIPRLSRFSPRRLSTAPSASVVGVGQRSAHHSASAARTARGRVLAGVATGAGVYPPGRRVPSMVG